MVWARKHAGNCWVAVKEFNLRYHNSETILFSIYPHLIMEIAIQFLDSNPDCGPSAGWINTAVLHVKRQETHALDHGLNTC